LPLGVTRRVGVLGNWSIGKKKLSRLYVFLFFALLHPSILPKKTEQNRYYESLLGVTQR